MAWFLLSPMSQFCARVLFALAILFPASATFAAGDPAAGQALSATCGACHGVDGNSINPEWPSLAGQGERYMVTALRQFKSGERGNVLMSSQAALLSEQDILDVSAYYANQTPKIGTAQGSEKMLELGQLIYRGGILSRNLPACIACHGPSGSGNAPAAFPRLAGQHATYLITQLKIFREGYRPHKDHTRQNSMMNSIASDMTGAEIEAVSYYISGLY